MTSLFILFSRSTRDTTEQRYQSLLKDDRAQQFLQRNGLVSNLTSMRYICVMVFTRRVVVVSLLEERK